MAKRKKQTKIAMHPSVLDVALQQYSQIHELLMQGEEAQAKDLKELSQDSNLVEGGPLAHVFGVRPVSEAMEIQRNRVLVLANVIGVFKPFGSGRDFIKVANLMIDQQFELSRKFSRFNASPVEGGGFFDVEFVSAHCAGEVDWDSQMHSAREFIRNALFLSSRFTYPKGFKGFDEDKKLQVQLLGDASGAVQAHMLTVYDNTPAVKYSQVRFPSLDGPLQ